MTRPSTPSHCRRVSSSRRLSSRRTAPSPRFSPDGARLTYETGSPPTRTTRLLAPGRSGEDRSRAEGLRRSFLARRFAARVPEIRAVPAALETYAAIEAAPPAQRQQRTAAFNLQLATESQIVVRELSTGRETELPAPNMRKTGLAFTSAGVMFSGSTLEESAQPQIYAAGEGSAPRALTSGDGDKQFLDVSASGAVATYSIRTGGGRGGEAANPRPFGVLQAPAGTAAVVMATAIALSADGSTIAYVTREGTEYRLMVAGSGDVEKAAVARKGPERLDAPALSRDGSRIAYQLMPKEDWEIFRINRDGSGESRVTREIQHDILPRFLDDTRILGMIGEARHRRSQVYDSGTGTRTRLFHNNTIRTIAPEYAWVPSPDGRKVLVVAERDGDTVSPERGVYLVDTTRRVSRDELRARLKANLTAEQTLRAKGSGCTRQSPRM